MTHNRTTHGMSGTPEHRTWCRIKHRCYNKNYEGYENYGGRGIKMCDRWVDSFENFYKDMGQRPLDKTSIDRKDNDGDYTPDNCRWSTAKEQNRNRSNARFITMRGTTKLLAEWCDESSVPYTLAQQRLGKGWEAERAIFTPPFKSKSGIPGVVFDKHATNKKWLVRKWVNGKHKHIGSYKTKAEALSQVYDYPKPL